MCFIYSCMLLWSKVGVIRGTFETVSSLFFGFWSRKLWIDSWFTIQTRIFSWLVCFVWDLKHIALVPLRWWFKHRHEPKHGDRPVPASSEPAFAIHDSQKMGLSPTVTSHASSPRSLHETLQPLVASSPRPRTPAPFPIFCWFDHNFRFRSADKPQGMNKC